MRRWGGLALLFLAAAGCGVRRLDDRGTPPRLPATALETVVALDYPPGNVAVAADGRVFFTFHPDADPPVNVVELRDGVPVPYPPGAGVAFETVLSLRVDRSGRLWTLDHGRFGRGRPRLLAFDLATDRMVHEYDFPRAVAGFPSMLNDFQVSPDGRWIYIAETSPLWNRPALVVYDVERRESRRLLDGHPALRPQDLLLQAPGRDMWIYGLVPLRIGLDSIALDRSGAWLYLGPLSGDRLYRLPAGVLHDPGVAAAVVEARLEDWAPKTISDGLTTDDAGGVYVTDPEHSAIHVIGPDRRLETLVRDERLRWPDGLSFGPDGWLYVTCSALHQVLFRPAAARAQHAPYHIYRLRPGATAAPGH